MALTLEDMDKQQKQILKHLDRMSQPASKATVGGQLLGSDGASAYSPWDERKGHWRNDPRIQNIAKCYSSSDAQLLMEAHHNSRRGPIMSGWGNALQKMAHIANPTRIQAAAIGVGNGYNNDNLETEHYIPTTARAKSYGVRQLNGEIHKAALAESAGITGGYTVPPQFMAELLTIAGEDACIEPRAKILPLTTLTAQWPTLDITTVYGAGITPYGGGVVATWQPEAQVLAETEPQFRETTWTAWTLTMYLVASNQLIQDNAIGLDALLTQLFSWALVWYKEYAFLQGLGAGSKMPLGVLNAPATIQVSRSVPGHFKFADAATMFSKLHWRSWGSSAWMMHYSLIPELMQMVDNSSHNQLVWLSPFGTGTDTAATQKFPMVFLNGLPIIFTEKLPKLGTLGDVVLVDWSQYVIANRMDLQIDVSPHVKFTTNQMVWRVIARCDGRPWLNSFISDASGYTSSPFVTMAA